MNLSAALPKPRSKGVVVPPSNAAPAKNESLATMSLPPRSQPGPAAPGVSALTTDDILGTLTAGVGNSSIVKEPAAASVQTKPAGQATAPVGLPPAAPGKSLPPPLKNAQMPRDMSILGPAKVLGLGVPVPPRTHTMPLPQGMRKSAIQLNLKGTDLGAGASVPSVAETVGSPSPSKKTAFAAGKAGMEVVAKSPVKESKETKSDHHDAASSSSAMDTGSDTKTVGESKRATGGKNDKATVLQPKVPADELDEMLNKAASGVVPQVAAAPPAAAPAAKKSTAMDTGKDEKQKPASPKKSDGADAIASFRERLISGVTSIKTLTWDGGKKAQAAPAAAAPAAAPAAAAVKAGVDDMLGDVGVATEVKPPAPKKQPTANGAAAPPPPPAAAAKEAVKAKTEPAKPQAPPVKSKSEAEKPPAAAAAASAKASPKKAKPAAAAAAAVPASPKKAKPAAAAAAAAVPAAAEEKPPKPAAALRSVHVAKPEDLSADMETEEAPVVTAKPAAAAAAAVKAKPAATDDKQEEDDADDSVNPKKKKRVRAKRVVESDDESPPAKQKPAAKAKAAVKPEPEEDAERTESEPEAEDEDQDQDQEQSEDEGKGKSKRKSKGKGKAKGKADEKKAPAKRPAKAVVAPKQWHMDYFKNLHQSGNPELVAKLHAYMENAGVGIETIATTVGANKKAGGAYNRLYDNLAAEDKKELWQLYSQYKHDRLTFLEEQEKRTAEIEAKWADEAASEGKGEKQDAGDGDENQMDTSDDGKTKSKPKPKPKPKRQSSSKAKPESAKPKDKPAAAAQPAKKKKETVPAAPASTAKKAAISLQPAADETPAKASARQMLQKVIAEKDQVIKRAAALQQAIKSAQPAMRFMQVKFKEAGPDGKPSRQCMFWHSTEGDKGYVRTLRSVPKQMDIPGGWSKMSAKEFINAIRGRTELAGRTVMKRVAPSITGGPDIETEEWSFVFRDNKDWFTPIPDPLLSNSLQIACALYSPRNGKIKNMPELIERLQVVEAQTRKTGSAVPLVDTGVQNMVAAYSALDKSHALPLDLVGVQDPESSGDEDFVAGEDEDTAAVPSPKLNGKAKSQSQSHAETKNKAKPAAQPAAAGVVLDLTSDDAAKSAAPGPVATMLKTLARLNKAMPQLATQHAESVLRAHQLIARLAETDDADLVADFNQIAEMNPAESDWSTIAADVGHFTALLAYAETKGAEASSAETKAPEAAPAAAPATAAAAADSMQDDDEEDAEEIRKSAEVDKQNRQLVDAAVKQGNVGLLVAAMNVVDDHDERASGPHMRVKLSATKDMEAAAKKAYKKEARLRKEGKLERQRGVYVNDSAKEVAGEEEEDEEEAAVGSEADSEDTSDEDDLGSAYKQQSSRKRKEAPQSEAEPKTETEGKSGNDTKTEEPAPKRQRTKAPEPQQEPEQKQEQEQEQQDESVYAGEFPDVKAGSEQQQPEPSAMDTGDTPATPAAESKLDTVDVASKIAAIKSNLTAETRERRLRWASPLEEACQKSGAAASELRALEPAIKAAEAEDASAQQLQEVAEDEPSLADAQELVRSHSEAVTVDGTQDPNASLEEAHAMVDDDETVPPSPELAPMKAPAQKTPKATQPAADDQEIEVDYEDGPI